MNYKVLYRKYRPSNFSGIVGQDYTVDMLQNAIKNNKISHAYLFTGPRGTGKTSTAKIFAKTINCLSPIDGEACGKCVNCLSFADSPDIIEIDAASNNGVDDIRELINNVKIAPSEGKYKIYIIDEVHMMTTSAFNALLLTLEEPPKHAIFIMATTNVENVPITILSRCQRFNFQKISLDNLKKQIRYVCDEEKILIQEDAIEEIAYLSEGGMRDALSLLDQLSSTSEEITVDKILSHYGSISSKFIKDLIVKLEKADIKAIIDDFLELENTSSDYKIFLKKMTQELTHICVKIKLGSYTGPLTFSQIKNIIFEFNEIMNKSNINMNPYTLIELTLFDNISLKSKDESSVVYVEKPVTLENKIEKEEKIPEQTSVLENPEEKEENPAINEEKVVQKTKYLEKLKQIRVNNCFVNAQKDVLRQYQTTWQQLEGNLKIKPDIISLILDSNLVAASINYAIISCRLDSTANLINNRLDEITEELKSFFNTDIHFIALSNEEWDIQKKDYIQKLKEKYVYKIIKEDEILDIKPSDNDSLEEDFTDVFDRDKIEIV